MSNLTKSQIGVDPADVGSLSGAFKFIFNKFLQSTDDMLPAVVLAFDRATNTAKVKPLIDIVLTNGDSKRRSEIASVPVLRLSGGGVAMSFNLSVGDKGWLKANDRDTTLYRQTASYSAPNTKRLHSFEDSIFIPDVFSGITIPAAHEDHFTIQTLDGSSCAAYMTSNVILQLDSTTKAFVPPRMTTAQRDAIPNPFEGMAVWNLDTHGMNYFNGTNWV